MYKYYFLKILSVILLTTAAHAGKGRLVLEATLSDEQAAVIKQKIIDPYVQNTSKTIQRETSPPERSTTHEKFKHIEVPKTTFFYPSLKALETMTYTTILMFPVDENEACKLENYYQNIIPLVDEINVDVSTQPKEHSYEEFREELSLSAHSSQLKNVNMAIKNLCFQDKEYQLYSSGTLVFGETTVVSRSVCRDDSRSLQLDAMIKRIAQLNSKNDRFSLTFKHFNLKYIDEEDKVIFSKPLELGQAAQ